MYRMLSEEERNEINPINPINNKPPKWLSLLCWPFGMFFKFIEWNITKFIIFILLDIYFSLIGSIMKPYFVQLIEIIENL